MFQRLVTCKTCGHSIANTAKKCPHCGAKQHTAVYVLVTIMVLIFFIASAAIIRSAVVTGDHSSCGINFLENYRRRTLSNLCRKHCKRRQFI